MPVPEPSVDELVQTLRHSSLPTLVVEGSDDMTVFRYLEGMLKGCCADALPCGGRDKLLELVDRRGEYSNCRTVFLADRDMWMFASIPAQYNKVVWTQGYSIENDALLDAVPENLMSATEQVDFERLCDSVCRWFASEVERYRATGRCRVDIRLSVLIQPGSTDLSVQFLTETGFVEPDAALRQSIRSAYRLQLRGKTLLKLYARLLDAACRSARHSPAGLLEFGCKQRIKGSMVDLAERIQKEFAPALLA